jgi:hypothetical protein
MIELFILLCSMTAAFCIGNITGYVSGKEHGEQKAKFELLIRSASVHMNNEREEVADNFSRQALAFSQKQKHWIKVYDAEINNEEEKA